MTAAEKQGKYPINAAVEIRCTTIDRQDALGLPGALPPALAATHSVNPQDTTLDTVLWMNVGTIPGTPGANEFFMALERMLVETWAAKRLIRFVQSGRKRGFHTGGAVAKRGVDRGDPCRLQPGNGCSAYF